ncbi:MAG: hypothetical protein IJQ47_01610 [Synergistaceae bacterium]|nr:hypothetical protein [Synergistaceae bacterium]
MKNGMSFVVFVFIVLLGIFFLLPEPVFAKMKLENGVYVIDNIAGSATINKRKKSVVREEAKKAAYNTLSEKLLDEIMPGIKEKENYDAVLEKVSSKISGLVKNFKIDSEQVSENDTLNIVGTCKINERALDDLIGSDIITLLGNPRVMILVDEKVGGGLRSYQRPKANSYEYSNRPVTLLLTQTRHEPFLILHPQPLLMTL